MGMDILCVHTDADSKDTKRAYAEKINPAKEFLSDKKGEICKSLIPIVPVRMVEAWMLADKELLKEEMGTRMSDEELGINRMPELYLDPKATIIQAIGKSNRTTTRIGRIWILVNYMLPLVRGWNWKSCICFLHIGNLWMRSEKPTDSWDCYGNVEKSIGNKAVFGT